MDLFVREYGPVGAPAIVFLHGAKMSGWSWEPVVQRMQHYHCLVPDLPQYGKSFQEGPFEMGRAADAVGQLIRSRVASGRAHLVGFSLGAQVGVQLLATEPRLVDRAVMCGTAINTMPYVWLTQLPLGLFARMSWLRRAINGRRNRRDLRIPAASIADYRQDVRLITSEKLVQIIAASSGFTLPKGLDKSDSPTLFLTGGKEMRFVHRWGAALAQPMPNGIDRVAIGMRHDWPLRYPELFSRTVDGWLNGTALPPEIVLPRSGRR
jgi:pimeloyl-ACP methyl ester carboxylesterase